MAIRLSVARFLFRGPPVVVWNGRRRFRQCMHSICSAGHHCLRGLVHNEARTVDWGMKQSSVLLLSSVLAVCVLISVFLMLLIREFGVFDPNSWRITVVLGGVTFAVHRLWRGKGNNGSFFDCYNFRANSCVDRTGVIVGCRLVLRCI